jgi:uncharacterized protein (UPF0335 family)
MTTNPEGDEITLEYILRDPDHVYTTASEWRLANSLRSALSKIEAMGKERDEVAARLKEVSLDRMDLDLRWKAAIERAEAAEAEVAALREEVAAQPAQKQGEPK